MAHQVDQEPQLPDLVLAQPPLLREALLQLAPLPQRHLAGHQELPGVLLALRLQGHFEEIEREADLP